jgi:hypothetical protein
MNDMDLPDDCHFFLDGGLPNCCCHDECRAESRADSQQGELWQLCRCPSLIYVIHVFQLSINSVANLQEQLTHIIIGNRVRVPLSKNEQYISVA